MNRKNILEIQSLSKGFTRTIKTLSGTNRQEQNWVINQLSMYVPFGKAIVLIGGNGAGKTTLFNIISGFVKPDAGSIKYSYNNVTIELARMAPHQIARKGIGRMFQDNHIFPEMSILDNMLLADDLSQLDLPFLPLIFQRKAKHEEKEKIAKVKSIFDNIFGSNNIFWEKRENPARFLSYGQQRLLGLARLFLRDYYLLLLDEPTSGVNPEVIIQIKNLIKILIKSNRTVLLIEHNLDVVYDIADFCFFMDQGRIAWWGTPKDMIGNEEIRKLYIGL